MTVFYTFFFFCFASFPVLAQVDNRPSCSTTKCHNNYKKKAVVHGPVKANGCRVCHLEKDQNKKKDHPLLEPYGKTEQVKSCFVCHDDLIGEFHSKGKPHGAFTEKGCVGCHDPHSSKHKKLLKAEPQFDLCMTCHKEDVPQGPQNSHHDITKMKKGCLSCHETHASKNQSLLKTKKSEICSTCHDKAVRNEKGRTIYSIKLWSERRFLHTPVKKGECTSCHDVHGSPMEKLLTGTFSNASYVSPLQVSQSLCMDCHKKQLISQKSVDDTTTKFRDGSRNLHFVHISGTKKKRNCQVCHEVHGGHNKALIKNKFVYKGMVLPLKYKSSTNGGTCTTACHSETSYSRKKVSP